MPLQEFQKKLENDLRKSVKLVINDNHSTLLSVKWGPKCTKISMHRFFLEAPSQVMEDVAFYIRKKHQTMSPNVKSFIEENLRGLDYTHRLDKYRLIVQGLCYNLDALMRKINAEYFKNQVQLNITWFGKEVQHNRSRITFGLYHEPLKLIKINRLLDHQAVPEFFVSYVIYHEMLHHVCPSYCDANGKRQIHNPLFKMREKQFKHYEEAQDWVRENRDRLFNL